MRKYEELDRIVKGDYRAFIVCDVLVQSTKSVGDNKEIAPNGDCDTFQSKNGYVYVKFDDHTFILNTRYITINRAILFRHFIGVENANLRAYFDNSDNGFWSISAIVFFFFVDQVFCFVIV